MRVGDEENTSVGPVITTALPQKEIITRSVV